MLIDFVAVLLDEERVHLRTEPDELDDRLAECFVFELADHLDVRRVVDGTLLIVGGEVEVLAVSVQLLVEVSRLHPVHEGVDVGEEEFRCRVLSLEVVVVKAVYIQTE